MAVVAHNSEVCRIVIAGITIYMMKDNVLSRLVADATSVIVVGEHCVGDSLRNIGSLFHGTQL
jgi:hypothetical protein